MAARTVAEPCCRSFCRSIVTFCGTLKMVYISNTGAGIATDQHGVLCSHCKRYLMRRTRVWHGALLTRRRARGTRYTRPESCMMVMAIAGLVFPGMCTRAVKAVKQRANHPILYKLQKAAEKGRGGLFLVVACGCFVLAISPRGSALS